LVILIQPRSENEVAPFRETHENIKFDRLLQDAQHKPKPFYIVCSLRENTTTV